MKNIMCTDKDDQFPSIEDIDSLTRGEDISDEQWNADKGRRRKIIKRANEAISSTVHYDIERWTQKLLDRIDDIFCEIFRSDGDIIGCFGTDTPQFIDLMAQYRNAVIDYLEDESEDANAKGRSSPFPPNAISRASYYLFTHDKRRDIPFPLLTASVIDTYHKILTNTEKSISEVSHVLINSAVNTGSMRG